jgi:transposase
MGKTRAAYPEQFRAKLLELYRNGRSIEDLARQFEPSEQTIRNWIAQDERDRGKRKDGLSSLERDELNRLRRENRRLKQEQEILAKAAAWFARETDKIPQKDSDS